MAHRWTLARTLCGHLNGGRIRLQGDLMDDTGLTMVKGTSTRHAGVDGEGHGTASRAAGSLEQAGQSHLSRPAGVVLWPATVLPPLPEGCRLSYGDVKPLEGLGWQVRGVDF